MHCTWAGREGGEEEGVAAVEGGVEQSVAHRSRLVLPHLVADGDGNSNRDRNGDGDGDSDGNRNRNGNGNSPSRTPPL